MTHNYKYFEENRKEHVDAVRRYEDNKRVIIKAPVKSGKRELKIIEALRSREPGNTETNFIYTSSLDRKDNKEQHEEMRSYGIECSVSKNSKQILQKINRLIMQNQNKIVLFIDESDYGTSVKQKMCHFFDEICKMTENLDRFYLRYFSATNKEIELSEYGESCCVYNFIPPESYRGAQYFLENNLVHEAEPFFIYDNYHNVALSDQGVKLLQEFSNQNKVFSVLRIANKNSDLPTYSEIMESEALREFIFDKYYGIKLIGIDQNSGMGWGKPSASTKNWSDYFSRDSKKLFVINQTCTRSTELGFIPQIYFWHECRSPDTPYNTIIQSSMRVCHYPYQRNEKYWAEDAPDTNVQIYTNKNCIRLYAEQITDEDFIRLEKRPLSSRISSSSYFVATDEMIKNRTIEFLKVPEDIIKNIDFKQSQFKNKRKYPLINEWGMKNEKILKHISQYRTLSADKSFFIRTMSANGIANISEALLLKKHHSILAPCFIDGPNSNFVKDFNKLIVEHPDCINSVALVHLSEEELKARKEFRIQSKTKNSMYTKIKI
jgi:hypothetical protein